MSLRKKDHPKMRYLGNARDAAAAVSKSINSGIEGPVFTRQDAVNHYSARRSTTQAEAIKELEQYE